MNDDYLWDKSGEPDPEVQQLEEVLGTLRYQPRELEIPAHIQPRRRSFITRGLAIAAAIALLAVAVGVWTRIHRQAPAPIAAHAPAKIDNSGSAPAKPADELTTGNTSVTQSTNATSDPTESPRHRSRATANRRSPATRPQLSPDELAEARVAKDQLILALRVASSKLSQAQKKTQGNEIHNQHKAG